MNLAHCFVAASILIVFSWLISPQRVSPWSSLHNALNGHMAFSGCVSGSSSQYESLMSPTSPAASLFGVETNSPSVYEGPLGNSIDTAGECTHTTHAPISPASLACLTNPIRSVKQADKIKKKPALACHFCRGRKIACGPPAPGSSETSCKYAWIC